mgnify:CR=1 FL=1|jgi:hypothetical protein
MVNIPRILIIKNIIHNRIFYKGNSISSQLVSDANTALGINAIMTIKIIWHRVVKIYLSNFIISFRYLRYPCERVGRK